MRPLPYLRALIALAALACCFALLAPGDASAAIGFRAARTSDNAPGANSLTISVPAGTTTGDVMIATVVTGGGISSLGAPAGWTAITNTTPTWSGSARSLTYYRAATATEPGSYTWTFGANVDAAGDIVTYTGVNTTYPIGGSAAATDSGTNSTATPTATSITANARVIANATWRRNAGSTGPTITKDAATTQRATGQSASGPPFVGVMTTDVAQAAAGTTTARTFTSSASHAWVTQTIALNPAGGSYSFPTAPNLPNMPSLTLNGAQQTLTAAMPNFSVDDESGSQRGWNVTVNGDNSAGKSPVFARYCPNATCGSDTGPGYVAGGASLAASSLTLDTTGASFTGGVGTAPAFQCGTPCALDVASANTAKVVSVDTAGGMATWTSTGFGAASVSLAAPTTVRALPANEVYRVDLLWTLNFGP
jgi:hypothetical protein